MKIAPCKNCPDRYVGCHDKCESYTEWAKAARSERLALDKDDRMRNAINEILGRPADSPRGAR